MEFCAQTIDLFVRFRRRQWMVVEPCPGRAVTTGDAAPVLVDRDIWAAFDTEREACNHHLTP